MKAQLLSLLLAIFPVLALGEPTPPQAAQEPSIAEANRLYPDLKKPGTPIRVEAERLMRYYRQHNPAFLHTPDAPLAIATQAFLNLSASNATAPAPSQSAPPAPPPDSTYTPVRGGLMYDAYPDSDALGRLSILNNGQQNAICKLIDRRTNLKIASILIIAGQRENISAIPDGSYRILFSYGDAIIDETDRFAQPVGFSEFQESFEYATTVTARGSTQYATFQITLKPVANGQARVKGIDAAEFDRY